MTTAKVLLEQRRASDRARAKRYRVNNPDEWREVKRRSRRKHRDKLNAIRRKYWTKNRDRLNAKRRARRAAKKGK